MTRAPLLVPRRQPQQDRARATVEAILIAAEQVLAASGGELTTTAVAERAGVSIGTYYQYFPNRESLVAALSARQLDRTFDAVHAAVMAIEGAPLAQMIEPVLRALACRFELARTLHAPLLVESARAGITPVYMASLNRYVDLVAGVLAASRFRGDCHAAAFVLVNATDGVIRALALAPDADLDAVVREGTRVLTRFLDGEAAVS